MDEKDKEIKMKLIGKTKRYALIVALIALMGIIALFAATPVRQVSAEETAYPVVFSTDDTFFAQEYDVGDVVTIPDGTFSAGGDTAEASYVLITPDGHGKIAEEIELTQRGEYTVRYTATLGGRNVEQNKTFLARTPLFTTTGERSQINIGKASEYSAYEAGGKSGAIVSIAMNESIQYNKALDLSQSTAADSFVSLSVLPAEVNVADANKIILKLTDAYDPSNVVTIEMKKVRAGDAGVEEWSYVTAYAVGQQPQGLEGPTDRGSFVYEGQKYNRHINNSYGQGVKFAISGMATFNDGAGVPDKIGEQEIAFSYDSTTKRVYAGGKIVIDLDDPTFNSTLFEGFTDGKCFLSISAASYLASSCNLLLNSVGGEEVTADELYLVDEEAPALLVEDGDLISLDELAVGVPVRLPEARGLDLYDGECAVDIRVYSAYGSTAQADVGIVDGYFTPAKAGLYTIVYTTADACGNAAKKEYTFESVIDAKKVSLNLAGNPSKGTAGQELSVRVPIVENAAGNWTMRISVSKVGSAETEEIAAVTSSDGVQYVTYRPMDAGDYTFSFSYRDYLYETSASIQVKVSGENAKPIFLEEALLPEYIIAGAEYEVPVLFGWVFPDGNAAQEAATLYITEDGDIDGAQPVTESFTVNADWSECYFTYVIGEGVDAQTKTYSREVKDVGFGSDSLALEKYFDGYSSAQRESDGILYTLDGTLTFVNFVQTISFRTSFTIPSEGVDRVAVSLTDPEGGQVTFVYRKAADGTIVFSFGNGTEYTISSTFAGAAVTLSYDSLSGILSPYSGTQITADLSASLASGKASLSFHAEGSAPALKIVSINNQNFAATSTGDRIRPEIIREELLGSFSLGDTVTLAPAYAADVLSPTVTVELKVTAPDGSVVTSVDGVRLEGAVEIGRTYEIVLEQYGFYRVSYTATDAAGNTVPSYYNISVVDNVKPQAEIGSHSDSASVGDSITVAAVTVTDNVTAAEDCSVFVYVQPPQSAFVGVEAGGSFVANKAGVWKVWYYVADAAGNLTVVGYEITVS